MELDIQVKRLRASKRRWQALASFGGLLILGSALALDRAQAERNRQEATVAYIKALASQPSDVLKMEYPEEGGRDSFELVR
ncbi:hypothetical protein SAMN05444166_5731 [Singulisphaera sp. GP187]|uniref:hypothetical protein n=1 Tax=Singulisphaera sp. GP187 TaxID=1882752 RepID=UPI0009282A58|nr:hypothetical protein [Singulisphaera sp. GP187]SIO58577.1 hypothetical protein SAMN05444166_5731 [Singulisphaera sp. GP187]